MPTSIPRTRSVLTIVDGSCRSVTGEAEEVPSVVHEFVHILAADQRSRPLLGADEIDRQQKNEPGENRPGKPLTQRYRGDWKCRCKCSVRHIILLGFTRPVELCRSRRGSGFRPVQVEYSGATAPESHRLPRFAKTSTE